MRGYMYEMDFSSEPHIHSTVQYTQYIWYRNL